MYSTIPAMFEASAERFSSNVLLREKKDGFYIDSTYRQVREQVLCCAAGLMQLGVRKGDRIALLSEGRNEWVVAELGMLYAGAVNVPLSVKIDELAELKFRLAHAGCRMVLVSGSQAHKVRQVCGDLPELERVISFDAEDRGSAAEESFRSLVESGKEFLRSHSSEVEARRRSVAAEDMANICYTSGTTADPKGIILTHRNYTANVEQTSGILNISPSDTTLLILPWDHSFAHLVMYLLMHQGASFASVQQGKTPAETLRNIPANLRETQPTILLSVPALAKNFRKNIEKGVREKGEKIERLFRAGLAVAEEYNRDGFTRGQGVSLAMRLKCLFYDWVLFRKLRAGFGGRLQFFIGGGAMLDIELQRFFYAIGIPMYQGYGLTEAAPVISANVPERHKMGSSGSVLPGIDIRICDDDGRPLPIGERGEIVIRGENVMAGYWKNEKASRETVRDGWLYTGDLGYLDPMASSTFSAGKRACSSALTARSTARRGSRKLSSATPPILNRSFCTTASPNIRQHLPSPTGRP